MIEVFRVLLSFPVQKARRCRRNRSFQKFDDAEALSDTAYSLV